MSAGLSPAVLVWTRAVELFANRLVASARMTANRAALTGLVALYVVLGSLHEEHRLRTAYGAAYERYGRTVPFLTPRPSRG